MAQLYGYIITRGYCKTETFKLRCRSRGPYVYVAALFAPCLVDSPVAYRHLSISIAIQLGIDDYQNAMLRDCEDGTFSSFKGLLNPSG